MAKRSIKTTQAPEPQKAAKAKPEPKAKKPVASLPLTVVQSLPTSVRAAKLMREAMALLPDIAAEIRKAERQGPVSLARAFVALHRLKKITEEHEKLFNATFEAVKGVVIPQAFENSGVDGSVPLSEGFRVQVSQTSYASIKTGMKDAAMDWLVKNGYEDLIDSTVNASTLSASVRKLREEKNLDFPEELFNVTYAHNTSVVATK